MSLNRISPARCSLCVPLRPATSPAPGLSLRRPATSTPPTRPGTATSCGREDA
ncbi:uncharacterized protein TRAVEDRAFT_29609 [Trametes versicolor FP-101664 SS1]|uniref:uncharacterized protein n=1 Tax=Trametes versicolor (strain FP-101664) TaxID=717944 RepID=UPI00046244F3|nr:uncharacterized protein TRAVEDRAFT_29609 [Trametes versicolor FP-101664 SS1]EIW57550.1 hypothetical protein TRAVEDRAFT_29609 [Trametes versicolor FP-101664 SS1]